MFSPTPAAWSSEASAVRARSIQIKSNPFKIWFCILNFDLSCLSRVVVAAELASIQSADQQWWRHHSIWRPSTSWLTKWPVVTPRQPGRCSTLACWLPVVYYLLTRKTEKRIELVLNSPFSLLLAKSLAPWWRCLVVSGSNLSACWWLSTWASIRHCVPLIKL